MKKQSYKFSVSVLDEIIKILENDFEICGYISKKENLELELNETRFKGQRITKGQRGSCRWGRGYQKYMWHTHPNMSKGYPSVEDIFMVFKHKDKVCTSFIFSKWGIWEISAKQASIDKRIEDIVKNANDWLYFQQQVENIEKYIKFIKDKVQKYINVELEIYFTPWSEINEQKKTEYQTKTIFL